MNYTISALLTAKDVGFASTMARASAQTKSFSKEVENTGSRTSRLGAGLKAAFAGLATVAAAFFVNAIGQATRFETAMRNVNSIARLSEQDFAALNNQVLQLSTRLPQSAQTLAEGLYDIVSSGFEGAGAMQVLEASAMAASAGMTTTEVSARAISAAINAYGLSARDATDISDILFQTVNLGVVSFEELASGLGNVVGGAAAAGVELDEVGAAIAAMTLSGLGAEESITSLNRLLEKIIKPSDQLAAMFENLGYESGQAALDANGLYGTMELLRHATGGQVTELLKLFPEIRAARGAFALMAADGQNYANTFAGIADETERAGATQAAFREQSKALSAQWQLFVNGFNAFSIRVGTALLPALKSGLEGLTEFGAGLGNVMSNLATAAGPAIRSLGDALQEVGRLFGVVVDAVKPLAQVLGAAFAGATIAALHAFAEALDLVAGALADHPALIQAVAVVLGGVLLSRVVAAAAAFMRLRAAAVTVFAAGQWATFSSVLGTLVGRLQLFAAAIANIRLGNLAAGITNLRGAFSGLSSIMASPALAGTVIVGGLYAIQTAFNNADQHARDFINTLNERFDISTMEGLRGKAVELQSVTRQLDEEWENLAGTSNSVTAGIRGFAEVLSPFHENRVLDNARATSQLREELESTRRELARWEEDIVTVANLTGASRDEVAGFLDELEGYDPTDNATTTQDLARQFRELAAGASGATPATETLSTSMATAGDLMSTAAEKASAFNDTLDALFGTMIGSSNAAIAFQQALDDMTAALEENGNTLNIDTQEGRDNASAINEAAQAAIDHASAVVDSTGSMQEGVNTLQVYRQQLLDQMEASGMSREAAERYLETLGLTPENLETTIELAGEAEATEAMGQVFDAINQLDLTVAEPTVELDNLPFLNNAQAVGEFIAQVGMANPQATVTLDDSQFVPTAQQVTAWAQQYEDSSPRAMALLNIIDPQNDFRTLSEAAERWEATHASGTAGLNTSPARAGFQSTAERMEQWRASSGSGTAGLNDGPAQERFNATFARLLGWDGSSGTADAFLADYASSPIGRVRLRLLGWDSDSGTASAFLSDLASRPLSSIISRLNDIDGRVARASVQISVSQTGRARLPGSTNVPQRWGGIVKAQSGFAWQNAGIATSPTVFWGERETGGEAYIPRNGNRARSLQILETAAGWYGMSVVPKDAIAAQAGLMLGSAASSQFRSVGDGIAREIRRSTDRQINSDVVHFHYLTGWMDQNVARYLDWATNGIETLIRIERLGARNVRVFEDLASIPRFDGGGMVPGRLGEPVLSVNHGGERVLTPAQQRQLSAPQVVTYQLGGQQVVVQIKGDVVDAASIEQRISAAVGARIEENNRNLVRQLKVRR